MKIHELVEAKSKGKINHQHRSVISNAQLLPRVDQGYGLYRFGLRMATSPAPANVSRDGAIGNTPFFIPYSDADANIIKHACEAGGFGSIENLTQRKSSEPDDTHRVSPFNSQAHKGKRR